MRNNFFFKKRGLFTSGAAAQPRWLAGHRAGTGQHASPFFLAQSNPFYSCTPFISCLPPAFFYISFMHFYFSCIFFFFLHSISSILRLLSSSCIFISFCTFILFHFLFAFHFFYVMFIIIFMHPYFLLHFFFSFAFHFFYLRLLSSSYIFISFGTFILFYSSLLHFIPFISCYYITMHCFIFVIYFYRKIQNAFRFTV